MSVTTGLVKEHACPICGGYLWRNEGGLYYCTNRNCPEKWHGYTLEPVPQPPPQPKKESVLGVTTASETKTLTSSQQYIAGLRRVLGYKSNKQIHRLRKHLGDINIAEAVPSVGGAFTNSSHEVIITYHPAGGIQRFPLVQNTKEVEPVNIRLQQIQFSGRFPHMRGFVNPQLSGQAAFAKCYVTDSTGPQANV